MIDKNGKIFGLINVVDLFIIIAVIGAAFFISKKMSKTTTTVETTKPILVKYYVEELPEYVAASVKEGDRVEDEIKNLYLGSVTKVDIGQGFTYEADSNGELKRATKEGYNSLEVTTKLNAQTFENGFIVEGNKYSIGHGFTIRMGKAKWYVRISSIEVQ